MQRKDGFYWVKIGYEGSFNQSWHVAMYKSKSDSFYLPGFETPQNKYIIEINETPLTPPKD